MTVFAHELARRYGDQGIVTTSLTPGENCGQLLRYYKLAKIYIIGVIKTDLQRHIRGVQAFIVVSRVHIELDVVLLIL